MLFLRCFYCVFITISDNANGNPQKVLDKIFEPLFSTKPTGEGTGLGLTLSYDILKADGGEIKVETREGLGTDFIISCLTKNIKKLKNGFFCEYTVVMKGKLRENNDPEIYWIKVTSERKFP